MDSECEAFQFEERLQEDVGDATLLTDGPMGCSEGASVKASWKGRHIAMMSHWNVTVIVTYLLLSGGSCSYDVFSLLSWPDQRKHFTCAVLICRSLLDLRS